MKVERLSVTAEERVGGGETPALSLEVPCCGALCDLDTSRTWASAEECAPTPCTQPPRLPVTIWETLSVPLTFAPIRHPLIYSAKLAVQTLCWLWEMLRPLGPGYFQSTPSFVPSSFSSCFKFNPDPPPSNTPLFSSEFLRGVSRSDNYSGQVDT